MKIEYRGLPIIDNDKALERLHPNAGNTISMKTKEESLVELLKVQFPQHIMVCFFCNLQLQHVRFKEINIYLS